MSYEPHHFTNDPHGQHAATRRAHARIRDLDREIAAAVAYQVPPSGRVTLLDGRVVPAPPKLDDHGIRDLRALQADLVARHGRPPSP
jgi:hypothetical protein